MQSPKQECRRCCCLTTALTLTGLEFLFGHDSFQSHVRLDPNSFLQTSRMRSLRHIDCNTNRPFFTVGVKESKVVSSAISRSITLANCVDGYSCNMPTSTLIPLPARGCKPRHPPACVEESRLVHRHAIHQSSFFIRGATRSLQLRPQVENNRVKSILCNYDGTEPGFQSSVYC